MAFPRELLNEGEEVALELHPHFLFLLRPALATLGSLVLLIVAIVKFDLDPPIDRYLAAAALVASAIWLGLRYLRWTTTEFIITGDRLIYRSGVIAKQGREIPLERVNDIHFSQSLFERLIGCGDLMIESGGERGQQTFSDVRKPQRVQNEIYRQIEGNQNRLADRMAGRHEASIPDQIEKLKSLHEKGLVSDDEFEAKRRQLLDRM